MSKQLWNPWHGCHKYSAGCANCYVFYLDKKRDKDANIVAKSKTNFNLPLKKRRDGSFVIQSGSEVAVCFTSDFFIDEADEWRNEAWEIIKCRQDVNFLICTKRVERIEQCLPSDWGDGYGNVILAATCENQKEADARLPVFLNIPSKRRYILIAPILEYVNLNKYLNKDKINRVSVGGESYENARACDFEWIKRIYSDCKSAGVLFDFHQTGSNFIKEGKLYRLKHNDEYKQAKKGMEYLKLNF